jgi:hypothetical protein
LPSRKELLKISLVPMVDPGLFRNLDKDWWSLMSSTVASLRVFLPIISLSLKSRPRITTYVIAKTPSILPVFTASMQEISTETVAKALLRPSAWRLLSELSPPMRNEASSSLTYLNMFYFF